MVILLSPETEIRIRELAERGGYDGPEAVVNEALQALRSGISTPSSKPRLLWASSRWSEARS